MHRWGHDTHRKWVRTGLCSQQAGIHWKTFWVQDVPITTQIFVKSRRLIPWAERVLTHSQRSTTLRSWHRHAHTRAHRHERHTGCLFLPHIFVFVLLSWDQSNMLLTSYRGFETLHDFILPVSKSCFFFEGSLSFRDNLSWGLQKGGGSTFTDLICFCFRAAEKTSKASRSSFTGSCRSKVLQWNGPRSTGHRSNR